MLDNFRCELSFFTCFYIPNETALVGKHVTVFDPLQLSYYIYVSCVTTGNVLYKIILFKNVRHVLPVRERICLICLVG